MNHLILKKRQMRQTSFERENGFIKSVLGMDLWFLICYSPFSIFELTIYMNEINYDSDVLKLVYHSTVLLTFIEMTCNVFVYYFCNSLFKEYFHSMISSCFKKRVGKNNNLVNVKKIIQKPL